MEIINNNAKVEQVEIISNDNQNNNKNNFCLPPLFCIPSSTIIIGQDVEQKKHQKYYSKIAGLQQLIACCILILATFPGHTFGWAFFLPDIRKELNLSRSSLAVMWAVSLFLTAFILPFVGKLLHLYGQFTVVLFVSPLFAFAVMSVSLVNSWLFLGIGFFVLRLLGPGMLVLSGTTSIAKWFKFYRGKASLIVVSFSFFMIVVQKLVAVLIISYGWRGAYIALGMMIFTLLFVVLLLLRDDPVKYHLHPDLGLEDIHPNNNNNNNNNNNDTASSSPPLANINNTDDVVDELTRDGYKMLSYKETLRTLLFWSLIFAQSSVEFAWCGIQFYLVDILNTSKANLQLGEIADIQVIGSFVTMLVVAVVGIFVDRIPSTALKYVMILPLILGIGAIFFLKYGTTFGSICAYSMLFGSGMGINDLLTGVAYSTIFSKKEISKKLSIQLTLTHIFVGFGPLYCGLIRDSSTSYDFILWSYIVFKLICIVLILIAPLPHSMR